MAKKKALGRPLKIDWEEIEVRYKNGERIKDIAEKHKIHPNAVSNKAREQGWVHKDLKKEIEARRNVVTTVATATTPKTAHMTERQLEMVMTEITADLDPILRRKSKEVVNKFFEVTELGLEQAKKAIEVSADGLYIRSEGAKGTAYERTTSFLKDLAPLMNALQPYTGFSATNNTNNTQINISDSKNDIVDIETTDPIAASRSYQDLMQKTTK